MRQSNIELLRILCVIMVITLHVFGEYQEIESASFQHTCTFINSFCNTAVTIFILISGYYGIKFKLKKWVFLFTIVTFYGWLDIVICQILPPPSSYK